MSQIKLYPLVILSLCISCGLPDELQVNQNVQCKVNISQIAQAFGMHLVVPDGIWCAFGGSQWHLAFF